MNDSKRTQSSDQNPTSPPIKPPPLPDTSADSPPPHQPQEGDIDHSTPAGLEIEPQRRAARRGLAAVTVVVVLALLLGSAWFYRAAQRDDVGGLTLAADSRSLYSRSLDVGTDQGYVGAIFGSVTDTYLVYSAGPTYSLFALDATGEPRWSRSYPGRFDQSRWTGDGIVVATSTEDDSDQLTITKYSTVDGGAVWTYSPASVELEELFVFDRELYVVSADGIEVLDPDSGVLLRENRGPARGSVEQTLIWSDAILVEEEATVRALSPHFEGLAEPIRAGSTDVVSYIDGTYLVGTENLLIRYDREGRTVASDQNTVDGVTRLIPVDATTWYFQAIDPAELVPYGLIRFDEGPKRVWQNDAAEDPVIKRIGDEVYVVARSAAEGNVEIRRVSDGALVDQGSENIRLYSNGYLAVDAGTGRALSLPDQQVLFTTPIGPELYLAVVDDGYALIGQQGQELRVEMFG